MFILTVTFNENYHEYTDLQNENKFLAKQIFKIVTGVLFWLNVFELRKLILKIKVYSIDYDAVMRSILYQEEGMTLL